MTRGKTGFPFCLKDPLNRSPPAWENSPEQILSSTEKATYGLSGEEGWSCNCGIKGKKLTGPGPFHYLERIMLPLCTSVSVKQGNIT